MKTIIQITSGRGPVECTRVVAKVQEKIIKDLKNNKLSYEVINSVKGELNGTLLSSTILVEGDIDLLKKEWEGTILWICKSPYRKMYKRKNWFVGVSFFDVLNKMTIKDSDIKYETCRASGPGGQNINKVESAVRAIHVPSGIQVLSMDSRSQLENKKLSYKRLTNKLLSYNIDKLMEQEKEKWIEHSTLERGNAIKTIIDKL